MPSVKFDGAAQFRHRLVCATLAGRAIRIDNIRDGEEQPGVREFETCFLRLLEKVMNGCTIEINVTGTMIRYKPGLISGGRSISHDCGTGRSIGWFIEGILPLLLFAKEESFITLTGITNDDQDITIDAIQHVTLPLLRKFGVEGDLGVKIVKRGAPPLGGGQVELRCPIVKTLHPVNLVDPGRIRRIRGVAYATTVTPQMCNRMVESARAVIYPLLEDIYISTDYASGDARGNSPGFGISLYAETTDGSVISSECVHSSVGQLPEEIGRMAAYVLCEEMSMGGYVDSTHQSLVLLLMTLCPEDVSCVRLGKLTPFTVQFLRLLRDIFEKQFKITPEASGRTVRLACTGIGHKNVARPTQ